MQNGACSSQLCFGLSPSTLLFEVHDYYCTSTQAAPVVAEMSLNYVSVDWCKIDCDKQRELVSRHRMRKAGERRLVTCCIVCSQAKGVSSFPTFVIFKNRKPVYRQNGFSKASILKALQKQGADLTVCALSQSCCCIHNSLHHVSCRAVCLQAETQRRIKAAEAAKTGKEKLDDEPSSQRSKP